MHEKRSACRRRPMLFLVAVVLGACLSAGPALGSGTVVFRADLSGANEVPPVVTDTSGRAKLKVDLDEGTIDFDLRVDDGSALLAVAGAHLHCAPAGVNGPVVAFLAGVVPGGVSGRLRIQATVNGANIINPACGATVLELVDSILAGQVYVNVHSAAFPGGVVRGQLGL